MKDLKIENKRCFCAFNFKTILCWIIVGTGLALITIQYYSNKSIWLDEAFLTLNIINKSYADFLQPLSFTQYAPPGFLAVTKLLTKIFGTSEYVLRLFPFLCAACSAFLFYKILKYYIRTKAILIALGLFAVSQYVILFSARVKPYSSDVMIALMFIAFACYIQSKKLTNAHVILFGIVGAIASWFSYPAVFVLGGSGLSLVLFSIKENKRIRVGKFFIVYLFWLLSFLAFYVFYLRNIFASGNTLSFAENYWRYSFMPLSSSPFSCFSWLIKVFLRVFNNPLGLYPIYSAVLFCVGCVSIYFKKRKHFFILFSPLCFTLLASAMHIYPFSGRLLLFLVPFMIIFIAEGMGEVIDRIRRGKLIIGTILVILLFLPSLNWVKYNTTHIYRHEEIKPVLKYIEQNWQNGDTLYVYYGAQPAFRYYADRYGFNEDANIVWGVGAEPIWGSSRKNRQNYIKDLNGLLGKKRVWVLFSHVYRTRKTNEGPFFMNYLNSKGQILDSYAAIGSSVYLFSFVKKNP